MIGFCGALDFEKNRVDFSTLKKMCGLHGAGSAFINGEIGMICDGDGSFEDGTLQPVTLSYNGSLYTAAVSVPRAMERESGNVAQSVLEGYFELGEEFIHKLDFPYALALYDGRRGELLLAKGHLGDKPLFYSIREGTVYFASSLRPLIRLFGGCVRVSKKALVSFVTGDCSVLPDGLFCDIRAIRGGQGLFCSRLAQSVIPIPCGVYPFERQKRNMCYTPEYSRKTDIRRVLTDALFAFDYPQFDSFMPVLLPHLSEMRELGRGEVCVSEARWGEKEDYFKERAERLGAVFGMDVYTVEDERVALSARDLKSMDKALDGILEEYVAEPSCPLLRIFGEETVESIRERRSLPLRIRGKGMLIQSAMWLDTYNLIIV